MITSINKYSTSLTTRDVELKSALRFHHILIRTESIKKTEDKALGKMQTNGSPYTLARRDGK